MLKRRQRGEVAAIIAERRRREDEAPRLGAEVPTLASLSLAIDEGRPGNTVTGAGYIRRVVVNQAPALFVVPCAALGCDGGVHDLTPLVMRPLRQGLRQFEGELSCDSCACTMRLVGSAEYT